MVAITVLVVLVIDQCLKFWIKLNFELGDEMKLFGNWGMFHFIENKGMAYGIEIGKGSFGKLLLTFFRIFAVGGIVWFINKLIKEQAHKAFIFAMALILAGAIGNIIDSLFYGLIFDHSYGQVATLFPEGGGYGKIFQGRVVDMFYFPMIKSYWPDWVPFVGGKYFEFFRPIFNVADSAITTGVFIILIFQRKFFPNEA